MGNWGNVSREDFDNYNRDRKRVMDDHNHRVRSWIEDFSKKYVKNLK